jgi:hypothetical protein
MSHIFISYSKQDVDFVRYLRTLLQDAGFPVWVDEQGLTPSERWWRTIEQKIQEAQAVVVVMTPAAYESDWVERELLLAEKLGRPIFPILRAGQPWSRLANIQFEDMLLGLKAGLSARLLNALREVMPVWEHAQPVTLALAEADILDFEADAIGLKYAQGLYGADYAVSIRLVERGRWPDEINIRTGEYQRFDTRSILAAPVALYVGGPGLRDFDYAAIRDYANLTLQILANELPEMRHLAMTIHGPGFGLDEQEALYAQIAGYIDALRIGVYPAGLQRISIVERLRGRWERLVAATDRLAAHEESPVEKGDGEAEYTFTLQSASAGGQAVALGQAGAESEHKPYAVVLMDDAADGADDLFFYGIQGPVHAMGWLCERYGALELDEERWEQLKARLDTANAVIAEMSQPSPALYLQVGYALGKGRPTLLLIPAGGDVPFQPDCISYQRIHELEEYLLARLRPLGV